AGVEPWDAALPARFLAAATRAGWDDWRTRRSPHFLADTFDPDPWIALALEGELAPDPTFDRVIVVDALRAMCVASTCVEGSFRTRTAAPRGPITLDAHTRQVSAPARGGLDGTAPRYWIPPAVAARLVAAGCARGEIRISDVAEIPAIAAAICDGAPPWS
ncbi:MAG: hypothetical protein M3680_36995, partial [Myxococcota bacterium]|nr:hypothetical protein [Myxococcota bacterium]